MNYLGSSSRSSREARETAGVSESGGVQVSGRNGDYVKAPSLSRTSSSILYSKGIGRGEDGATDRAHVNRYFQGRMSSRILEFPIRVSGGTGREIPALYSLMNYADLVLGTWYTMGGMRQVADAMEALARELGVTYRYRSGKRLSVEIVAGNARAVVTKSGERYDAETVSRGDYHLSRKHLIAPVVAGRYDERTGIPVSSPLVLLFYLLASRKRAEEPAPPQLSSLTSR